MFLHSFFFLSIKSTSCYQRCQSINHFHQLLSMLSVNQLLSSIVMSVLWEDYLIFLFQYLFIKLLIWKKRNCVSVWFLSFNFLWCYVYYFKGICYWKKEKIQKRENKWTNKLAENKQYKQNIIICLYCAFCVYLFVFLFCFTGKSVICGMPRKKSS